MLELSHKACLFFCFIVMIHLNVYEPELHIEKLEYYYVRSLYVCIMYSMKLDSK
jgi:hypothetical protein